MLNFFGVLLNFKVLVRKLWTAAGDRSVIQREVCRKKGQTFSNLRLLLGRLILLLYCQFDRIGCNWCWSSISFNVDFLDGFFKSILFDLDESPVGPVFVTFNALL